MSLIVRYGDRLLAVARLLESTPDRWLVGLRWIAVAGMLTTISVGKLLVPPLAVAPLYETLAAVVLVNFAWLGLVYARRPPRGSTVAPQILVDVVLLGAMLWWSGGLTNPFAQFLSFQIVLAGLLTSSRMTLLVTALTLVVAAALHAARPLDLTGALWPPDRIAVIARLLSILALGLFLGFFVLLFARRRELLHEASLRNEKLAALGRTVAAMCHELNTPLGTIVIAGKDLEHIGRGLAQTEIEELARTVTTSAQRAADIISLLRGAVRPNAQTERVELWSWATRFVHGELDRLGYRGQRAVVGDGTVEVAVLPTALAQIVTNLLANAVDALRDIPGARIEVRVASDERTATLRIADNGRGVSPGMLERVGEPFQTTKAEGTGLGLYVSSLLAERMGGRLELESQPGEGAQLTLTLARVSRPSLRLPALLVREGREVRSSMDHPADAPAVTAGEPRRSDVPADEAPSATAGDGARGPDEARLVAAKPQGTRA